MTDPLPIHQANFHAQLPIGRGLLCGSSIHYQSVPIWDLTGTVQIVGSAMQNQSAIPSTISCPSQIHQYDANPINHKTNNPMSIVANVTIPVQDQSTNSRPVHQCITRACETASEIQDLPFTDCLKYTEGQPKEEDDQR